MEELFVPLNGSSKFQTYLKAFSVPSIIVERFANDTTALGKHIDAGIAKLLTGLGRMIKGSNEPATEGVSHLLRIVLPSVPTLKTIWKFPGSCITEAR